ncbi:MAG: cell division protein FtsX [Pseudomonadales bacterium]|jgi:cell division transport system permease protein|uniref:permease-like cell division protein FtsX n=1 Tax=Halopseudomonas TaxID=2901189 RepID=UPI000C58CC77|nr:permease-like cell division protein FtsX [Halopseudomonas aestusnigri]MAG99690.1 cell division protein FtsX [Pseudomonadales bacterium]MEE2799055.1 permease-like cell division protein FtsX [Pseudomonadota bacterium]HBT57122.1 cell division protein FtsX [Pseudomonas sp.]MAK74387.1 cell division protein FtsX [Pseudomonadales bacterium]MAP75670.1 cell division protein FtsX [Pseudomonadales bacterium]|tara:strand:+ start:5479 stop:6477 length:999 start_codon:yes stop_codon:yes gene_type:complete
MSSAKNPQPGRRKAPSGAARSQRDWRHPLRSWFGSHRDSARQALVRVRHYPFSSAMTVLVMTIALALPMGLSVLIGQVKQLGVNWQEAAQISVYLADDVSAEKQQSLTEQIRQLAGVAQAQLLDKDLALAEFQQHAGMGDALLQLDYNPLPSVIVVTPLSIDGGAAALEPLRDRLAAIDGVEQVQIDLLWVERLAAILAMFERFAGGLGVLLIIALLLVMANTIRLAIESRRDEILVIKLVGGTDAFVRRPFLYIGVLYGLLSGVLAWILLALGLAWLNVTVERVASLYQSEFALFGMPFTDGLALVFGSMVLGLAGAWLAVGQHVRAIEPQ